MRLRLRQFRALAVLTTLEVARQPICLLLATACVLLMAVASLQAYQFGEEGKFVRDSALAIHFVFGLLIGGYAACTALTRELKSGTASVVLSKPVSREMFFLAKFAGVAALIMLFSACAIPAILLSEKAAPKLYVTDSLAVGILFLAPLAAYILAGIANFFLKRPFASTAFLLLILFRVAGLVLQTIMYDPASTKRVYEGHIVFVNTAIQWRLVPAGILITMALIVLSGLALVLATVFGTVPVLMICAAVLLFGLTSDYLFGRLASAWAAAGVAYAVTPNWQHFWLVDALTDGGTISWRYVAAAGAYALFYTGAVLGAGLLLFRNREAA